jgi:hypothetical protein
VCDVTSCWIYEYIGILLGARPILHISRIKVKTVLELGDLLDIQGSVHHDTLYENDQQDATV